jgi:hypothetical protein
MGGKVPGESRPARRHDTSGLRRGGGRPKGLPNKVTREIKQAALALVSDPVYVANLQERLNTGKAPHMETLLHHYAYGKPTERHEHSGANGLPLIFTWQQ